MSVRNRPRKSTPTRGVSPNPKGSGWRGRVQVHGRRVERVFATEAEAANWVADRKGTEKPSPTLAQAIRELLEPEMETDGNAKYYEDHLGPAVDHFGPDRYLDTIERRHVRQYLGQQRATGVGKGTMVKRKQTLNRLFVLAIEDERLLHNPVSTVKINGPKKHKPKGFPYLPREEILELVDVVRRHRGDKRSGPLLQERDADMFLVCFGRGIRTAELARIYPEGVDLADKSLLFRWKTGEEHDPVLINQDSLVVPEADYLQAFERLMANAVPGQPLFPGEPDARPKYWRRRLRLDTFSLYVLRHSYCMALVERGVSIFELRDLMRHEHIVTTEKYYHGKAGQTRVRKAKLWLPGAREQALLRSGFAGQTRQAPPRPTSASRPNGDAAETPYLGHSPNEE